MAKETHLVQLIVEFPTAYTSKEDAEKAAQARAERLRKEYPGAYVETRSATLFALQPKA